MSRVPETTDDQQLRALEVAAQNEVALPADAFVIGEPVTAVAITYSRHPRAGLCWWRLGEARAAAALFRKMLWLNPSDNQGARFNLGDVEAGKAWNELER